MVTTNKWVVWKIIARSDQGWFTVGKPSSKSAAERLASKVLDEDCECSVRVRRERRGPTPDPSEGEKP